MRSSEPALVEVRDLALEYRRGSRTFRAVSDVSFDVFEGETLGLVGESGSGKTTIGRAIQGLLTAADGEIRLDGHSLESMGAKRNRELSKHVQTVFQDPFGSLNPSRTIAQTLSEPLGVHEPHLTRHDVRRRIASELDRVGLPAQAAERYPSEFSGGQRQRIAIARALIARPRLVICDEAVSALDLSIQAQILNLLAEIQAERSVSYLFISHDLAVVQHVAHRVLVLRRGELVDRFESSNFEPEARHPYTRRLFAAAPVPNPALQREKRAAFELLNSSTEEKTTS